MTRKVSTASPRPRNPRQAICQRFSLLATLPPRAGLFSPAVSVCALLLPTAATRNTKQRADTKSALS